MSNDDPKTETEIKKPGLLRRLLGGLFGFDNGSNIQSLKASKEPDIDRSIRYNDRNQRVSGGSIVALSAYLAYRDFSNFNIEFLADFNFGGPDFKSILQSYSQLISSSWDSITALVAIFFLFILIAFFVSTFVRGECLKRKARSIEINSVNDEVSKTRKYAEQVKAESAQYREIAKIAESDLVQLKVEVENILDDVVKLCDKADNALAEVAKLIVRIEKAEADATQYRNRAEKAEAKSDQLSKQVEETRTEEAYAVAERIKAETVLVKTKIEESLAAKHAYESISNSFNKENNN